MCESIKGELEVVENAFRQKTLIREVGCSVNVACCNDETTLHIPLGIQEANAEKLVRRWNGYPDLKQQRDGLLKACKPFARLADMIPASDAPDSQWIKFNTAIMSLPLDRYREIEAAIKKAQKGA